MESAKSGTVNKLQLIITAFENLDANMLELMLEEDRVYDGYPKEILVQRFREYFDEVNKHPYGAAPFNAYMGKVYDTPVKQTAYNFVNELGLWAFGFSFDGDQHHVTDIRQQWCIDSPSQMPLTYLEPNIFYLDDKFDYTETDELSQLKSVLSDAVSEIETELMENGFLKLDFCRQWFYEYLDFYDLDAYFDSTLYSFQKKYIEYALSIDEIIHYYESEIVAEKYWRKFISAPVLSSEFLSEWLVSLFHDFDFGLKDFEMTFDYKHSVFTSGPLRYDFNEICYTHNICSILQQNSIILPNPNRLSEDNAEYADDVADDEVFKS
ncbi:hypothetical protein [Chryseobacterium sp. R2A-55]|uniref:hypothetical protein n=1 Tax=Chryseobacterium sp. R2A-55 TaxID=2744445 RepID=UPI001F33524E|nr:hypothetical protein [Chryseobacterium sp. R2A-55]